MPKPKVETGIYSHFKGGRYLVTEIATHTETGAQLVIYEALGGGRKVWARPIEMFLEKVEHEGQTVPRFRWMR